MISEWEMSYKKRGKRGNNWKREVSEIIVPWNKTPNWV